MKSVNCRIDNCWLELAVAAIQFEGIAVVEGVFDNQHIDAMQQAMERAITAITAHIGEQKLGIARNAGYSEYRLALAYDPFFLSLLIVPEMLQLVDATLGDKAILRFQNLSVIPPYNSKEPAQRQRSFHMNTPRVMPGYVASLDIIFPVTPIEASLRDFTVAIGTHQKAHQPSTEYLEWAAVPVVCPAGGMVLFDSTLWHREGYNTSNHDRWFVNQQFTRSFIKPHFDYGRCLGNDRILAMPERLRQILGWYSRIPSSLDEFYLPPEERLYREGQG